LQLQSPKSPWFPKLETRKIKKVTIICYVGYEPKPQPKQHFYYGASTNEFQYFYYKFQIPSRLFQLLIFRKMRTMLILMFFLSFAILVEAHTAVLVNALGYTTAVMCSGSQNSEGFGILAFQNTQNISMVYYSKPTFMISKQQIIVGSTETWQCLVLNPRYWNQLFS